MFRCPKCGVWLGPFKRSSLLRENHMLTCPGCLAELRTTGIGAIVFGFVGFVVGLSVTLIVWLVVGKVWRATVAIPTAFAAIGAKLINPLEAVPPKGAPTTRSIT